MSDKKTFKPFYEASDFPVKLKAGKFRKGSAKWDNIRAYQARVERPVDSTDSQANTKALEN